MLMSATPILILLISNLFIGMLITWFYYRGTMSEESKKIEKLRTSLKNKDAKVKELQEELEKRGSSIEERQEAVASRDKNIREIASQVKERDKSIGKLNEDLAGLSDENDSLSTRLERREETIEALRDQMGEKEESIQLLEEDLETLKGEKQSSEARVEKEETELRELEGLMVEMESSIEHLSRELATSERSTRDTLTRAEKAEARITEIEAQLETKVRKVASQKARIRSMQDDLKVIDGIGPRVSSLLRSAGITSFSKLAERDADDITDILVKENPTLTRLTDPSTWQEQARMAADNDWEGLKALQDSIKKQRRAKDLLKQEAQGEVSDATMVVQL